MTRSLRYVVLHHFNVESPHFDLLFELEEGDETLTSLRCPQWPVRVGDRLEESDQHRRLYLTYEGPISNNRGQVRRVDEGTLDWRMIHKDPFTIGLKLCSIQSIEIVLTLHPSESAFDVQAMR